MRLKRKKKNNNKKNNNNNNKRRPGALTLCLNWTPSTQECFEMFWTEYVILVLDANFERSIVRGI